MALQFHCMPTPQHRLVRTFVELADTLVSDFDVTDVLYTLVERLIDHFDIAAAGLMLADQNGDLLVVASSSQEARSIELLEMQQREGPCYDAFRTGTYVVSRDLKTDRERWPDVADLALDIGFTAVHGVPMHLRGITIGAINLFEREPRLTDEEIPVIRGLAEISTIAILQDKAMSESRRTVDQLRIALRNRVTVEQARGIVAQADGVTVEEALVRLRQRARDEGRRLVEVAGQVVDGGRQSATTDS